MKPSIPNLYTTNAFFLNGGLEASDVSLFLKFLKKLGKRRGILFFNCEGGDEAGGFAMYSLIKLYKSNLVAIVVGECQSAAILPFMACTQRYCTRTARFMFHKGTMSFEEPEPQSDIMGLAKELSELTAQYEAIIKENTCMSARLVNRLMADSHYFGAQLALDYGFVQKIL